MDAALEQRNLGAALAHLQALIISCPPEQKNSLLSRHRLMNMPTFHYLARLNYREDAIPVLDKIIKLFIASGYDVNGEMFDIKRSRFCHDTGPVLLAAIVAKKKIFFESLVRNGARVDVCSKQGSSACHFAIRTEDLSYLQTLIKFGGNSVLTTTSNQKLGVNGVHPLLHTAVDLDQPDMVAYLLNKKEFGVDLNEKSVYRPGIEYTPLDRAFERTSPPVMKILLKAMYKGSKFSKFYLHLVKGKTEGACGMLDLFTPEELVQGKLEQVWALHRLDSKAFCDVSRVEFTKKLILHYVECGWKVDSESSLVVELWRNGTYHYPAHVTRWTLLLEACNRSANLQMIKFLVEEVGADVNCQTGGDVVVTPLLILIEAEDWEAAKYLIGKGADLNVRGRGNTDLASLMKRNLITGKWEPFSDLNSVELLMRIEYEQELNLLEMMVTSPKYIWNGAVEFHLAIEAGNLLYIDKVLRKCSQIISNHDLKWMTRCGKDDTPEIIPTLHFLFRSLQNLDRNLAENEVLALINLIELLVSVGLDLSLVWEYQSIFTVFLLRLPENSAKLVALFEHLLKCKDLLLNGNHVNWTVDALQDHLNHGKYCKDGECFKSSVQNPLPSWPLEIIKLFIIHGIHMSGVVINPGFHLDYSDIFKMMIAAGATTAEDYFSSNSLCPRSRLDEKGFDEFKTWNEEFERKERQEKFVSDAFPEEN